MPAGRAEPPGPTVPSLSQILLRLITAPVARQVLMHSYLRVSSSTFPPHTHLCPSPSLSANSSVTPTCVPQAGAEGMAKGETKGAPR